jgi:hypothetical protein
MFHLGISSSSMIMSIGENGAGDQQSPSHEGGSKKGDPIIKSSGGDAGVRRVGGRMFKQTI